MVRKLVRAAAALATAGALAIGCVHASAVAQDLHLAGLALHQETGRNIYLGGIYLEDQASATALLTNPTTPKVMEYRVVARRTSMRSLLGGMLLQSEVATGKTPDAQTTKFAGQVLAAVRGSLYAGDTFEIGLDDSGKTSAHLNGHELASIATAEVANYFIQGWIGERAPSTSFRDSLLADAIDPQLQAMLASHRFSETRGNEIAAWLAPAVAPAPTRPTPAVQAQTSVGEASGTPATQMEDDPAAVVAQQPQDSPPATTGQAAESSLEEPVQVASLTPLNTLLNEPETAQTFDIKEYSRRVASFHKQLVSMVYGEIIYPRRAVRRELQGRLELDITLTDSGELIQVAVVQSSGHKILDEAAVSAAREALGGNQLASVDPMAAAEFRSDNSNRELVVPVPIMFMLTQ